MGCLVSEAKEHQTRSNSIFGQITSILLALYSAPFLHSKMPPPSGAPPGDAGGRPKHAPKTRGRVPDASQHAKTANNPRDPKSGQPNTDPIQRIKEVLNELQAAMPGHQLVQTCVGKLRECIGDLRQTNHHHQQPGLSKTVCKQIAEIHEAVLSSNTNTPGVQVRSWAQVAGGPPQPAKHHASEITIRPMEDNKALQEATTPQEILSALDKRMERVGPLAARKLQSGDIRLVVQHKDYAIRNKEALQSNINATILRQNHPIEVCGVPLSLGVKSGKDADNSSLLKQLSTQTGKLVSGVQFTRVGWIPNKPKQLAPKARSSLILGVHSAEHQEECIRKGILIEGQLYAARLYDYGLQMVRCFRCSRWGHTSTHCKAPQPICGHCALPHDTNNCPDPSATHCINCKEKTHKAWEKRTCPVGRDIYNRTQRLRTSLLARTAELQNQRSLPLATLIRNAEQPSQNSQSTQSSKRLRTDASESDPLTRRNPVGRPPYAALKTAANAAGQTTLSSFSFPSANPATLQRQPQTSAPHLSPEELIVPSSFSEISQTPTQADSACTTSSEHANAESEMDLES